MNKDKVIDYMSIIHKYIRGGKVTTVNVEGEHDIKTFFYGINKVTNLKYIIIVFDISKNFKRELYIYNYHIKRVYFNELSKTMNIVLKEEF